VVIKHKEPNIARIQPTPSGFNSTTNVPSVPKMLDSMDDMLVAKKMFWLVVDLYTPLKNMKVKWDYCSQYMGK
jgi:hypothetical protein